VPIHFSCPGCSAKFSVADNLTGRKGKCKKCGADFVVPQVASPTDTDQTAEPKNHAHAQRVGAKGPTLPASTPTPIMETVEKPVNRLSVKHYFLGVVPGNPALAVWLILGIGLILVGLLVVYLCYTSDGGKNSSCSTGCFSPFAFAGILLVIIGIVQSASIRKGVKIFWSSMPSASQLDAWEAKDFEEMRSRAWQRTGLDESQVVSEPIFLSTVELGYTVNLPQGLIDRCRLQYHHEIPGDRWRCSAFSIMAIFITEKTIHAYRAWWSMIPSNENKDTLYIGREYVREYYLRDITSVSTDRVRPSYTPEQAALIRVRGVTPREEESLTLHAAGGECETFSVTQDIVALQKHIQVRLPPSTTVERAAASIRALLRSAKG
jgi:hypothetical protein